MRFAVFRFARVGGSFFHRILRGAAVEACGCTSSVDSDDVPTTGTAYPFNRPRWATPVENLIRPGPEHSIPFFWHLMQVGSVLSHMMRRFVHWKQPAVDDQRMRG